MGTVGSIFLRINVGIATESVQILSKLSIDEKQKKHIAEIMKAFFLLALMWLANDVRGEACYGNEKIQGMTCSASTEHPGGYTCQKAIDGNSGTDWATRGEGAGAWIQLNFPKKYEVKSLTLTHRATGGHRQGELFKDLTFEFSNGQTAGPFTMDNSAGSSKSFTIPNKIVSKFVKITATSAYTTINNGFSEIIVKGCPIVCKDKNENCSKYWESYCPGKALGAGYEAYMKDTCPKTCNLCDE